MPPSFINVLMVRCLCANASSPQALGNSRREESKKGNRPSYIRSAAEPISRPMYEKFLTTLSVMLGAEVEHGEFGADMQVSLVNDGPVTICIDSKNKE